MSGPPHHPHNRQLPATNAPWNHLQVPNFFPRQPQLAHRSNEHSILHQPTWHTPTTTETINKLPHTHIFGLSEMLPNDCFPPRHTPGVDLSVTRNGNNQNGDLPTTPISLSVRDTNKINSLSASVLQDIQAVELTKCSSPIGKSISPGLTETKKRSNIRVDSILERLNPSPVVQQTITNDEKCLSDKLEKNQSVIVQIAGSSHDENSNSSSILNVPTPTNLREEDTISTYSNEDSLDSNKSRRKRKPSKTVRVSKDDEIKHEQNVNKATMAVQSDVVVVVKDVVNKIEENKVPERRRSMDDLTPAKTRRKTSSESETIDNIAAMVQEGLKDKKDDETKPISVSVIKTKDLLQETRVSDTKSPNSFVEVENKLEEMFAGIEDAKEKEKINDSVPSTSQVTSTSSGEIKKRKRSPKKKRTIRRNSDVELTPKKKKGLLNKTSLNLLKKKKKQPPMKTENVKDVYAYDSGSNASSSRSRGPFIQIRGPRDSPISVNVINTPTNDEDQDKKQNIKTKKFHDDSEYRHKVRSKGLHCSTLSNKYDAQTRDTSWICAFCKRGPHASELIGPTINTNQPAVGDLFGPYFITTQCAEYLNDPYDRHFKSKKIRRMIDGETSTSSAGATAASSVVKMSGKKGKRKHSDSSSSSSFPCDLRTSIDNNNKQNLQDIYVGINETTTGTYEIWAHEDCIVWSPGTYLVGPKIVGLEEAVWTASNVVCLVCGLKGANICCLKRGCVNTVHLCCGRQNQWMFDDVNFTAYCIQHKIN